MATLLYEELEVEATATVEQIRKAYKKKALLTHPDRLPQQATLEQKKEAEENFRKVNHAYEVLSDPAKRKEYDIHGVWPPPKVPNAAPPTSQQPGFSEPFFRNSGFNHAHNDFSNYQFTDPFSLFDAIFGTMRPQTSRSFASDPFSRFDFLDQQFAREFGDGSMGFSSTHASSPMGLSNAWSPFNSIFNDPFFMGGGGQFSSPGMRVTNSGWGGQSSQIPGRNWTVQHTSSSSSSSRSAMGGAGGYVSESISTQTINGRTTTTITRIDAQGNRHVTKTLPDGSTSISVNGVQQGSSQGQLLEQKRRSSNSLPAPPAPPAQLEFDQRRAQPRRASQYTQAQAQATPQPSTVYHDIGQRSSTSHRSEPPPYYPPHTNLDHDYHAFMAQPAAPAVNPSPTFPHDRSYPQPAPAIPKPDPPAPGLAPQRSSMAESHHQNHLHATQHQSQDPVHPNPAPYYKDEGARDQKHRRSWWSRRRQ